MDTADVHKLKMKPAKTPIQIGEVLQVLTLAEDLLAANGFYKT